MSGGRHGVPDGRELVVRKRGGHGESKEGMKQKRGRKRLRLLGRKTEGERKRKEEEGVILEFSTRCSGLRDCYSQRVSW